MCSSAFDDIIAIVRKARCVLRYQSSRGQHVAYLGPDGPRWAPSWPHEPCYQGIITQYGHPSGHQRSLPTWDHPPADVLLTVSRNHSVFLSFSTSIRKLKQEHWCFEIKRSKKYLCTLEFVLLGLRCLALFRVSLGSTRITRNVSIILGLTDGTNQMNTRDKEV